MACTAWTDQANRYGAGLGLPTRVSGCNGFRLCMVGILGANGNVDAAPSEVIASADVEGSRRQRSMPRQVGLFFDDFLLSDNLIIWRLPSAIRFQSQPVGLRAYTVKEPFPDRSLSGRG
jgi:hypothetical protein